MTMDEQTSQGSGFAQEEPVFAIEEMESRLEMQIVEVPCEAIGSDGACCCIMLSY